MEQPAEEAPILACFCDGYCPDESLDVCLTKPGGYCYSALELTESLQDERTYGCISPAENGVILMCDIGPIADASRSNILCCNSGDFCNQNFPELTFKTTASDQQEPVNNYILAGLIVSIIFVFFVILAIIFYIIKRKQRTNSGMGLGTLEQGNQNVSNDEFTSASGSGVPTLIQRTIAKELQNMNYVIGKGRYGQVALAKWHADKVAVKIFKTTEETSWLQEKEIYQTALMRHENILGFIASDIGKFDSDTQMLLITDYHENGSLYDYLNKNTLSPRDLKLLAYSLVSGLTHIHSPVFETTGSPKKPAIAHRDIKSKNILVKKNGECAIGDFGLAITLVTDRDKMFASQNIKVGTKRYMAPEILDEKIDTEKIEDFQMADIYSVGLVFWEMCRLCSTPTTESETPVCEKYELPYTGFVGSDPSFKDMHTIVCEKQIRPQIEARWENEKFLRILSITMQECWHPNPPVRLRAFRIKKTLSKYM